MDQRKKLIETNCPVLADFHGSISFFLHYDVKNWDKSKVEISQNFVAFSEYMNFISGNSQNPVFRPYIEMSLTCLS